MAVKEGMIKGFTPRRIVTGHDSDGMSFVTSDSVGPPRNAEGPGMFDFWQEHAAGSFDTTSAEDNVAPPGTDGSLAHQVLAPPRGGHKFRFFCIPPSPKALADMTAEDREKVWGQTERAFSSFGADHEWTGTRVPGMHKTDTIDYIIVLQGKVTLVLDNDETELGPFDVVVQRATNHGWYVHPGDEPCMMVAVLIDSEAKGGKTVPELRGMLGKHRPENIPAKL